MTQPQPITLSVAADLLRKAVARRGEDTVVPSGGCYYVTKQNEAAFGAENVTWKPSCLVGEVLVEHFGLDTVTAALNLSDYNNSGLNGHEFVNITDDLAAAGLLIEPDAAQVLNVAQEVQDGRYSDEDQTWGTALKVALG